MCIQVFVGWRRAFLSKITPRKLHWLTTGISDPLSFKVGLLGIFLCWKKCTDWVLALEIVKPFIIAHLFILWVPCSNWRSAVQIYLDNEVMQKSSTNKIFINARIETICDTVNFYVKKCYLYYATLWNTLFLILNIW